MAKEEDPREKATKIVAAIIQTGLGIWFLVISINNWFGIKSGIFLAFALIMFRGLYVGLRKEEVKK